MLPPSPSSLLTQSSRCVLRASPRSHSVTSNLRIHHRNYGHRERVSWKQAAPHLDIEQRLIRMHTVLLVLLLLILSFWVSYYLKVRRIKSVHETLVALFAGGFIGLIVRLSPGTVVQNMISFSEFHSTALVSSFRLIRLLFLQRIQSSSMYCYPRSSSIQALNSDKPTSFATLASFSLSLLQVPLSLQWC